MDRDYFVSLVQTAAAQLPDLLIPLTGLGLSIYFLKHNRNKYKLTAIAFSLFLLIALGTILFTDRINQDTISDSQLGILILSCITGMISPIAWILLLISIFHPKYTSDDGIADSEERQVELPHQKASSVRPVLGFICLGIAALVASFLAGLFIIDWMTPISSGGSPGSGIGVIIMYGMGIPVWITVAILSPIIARVIFKRPSGRWKRIVFSFLVPVLCAMIITTLIACYLVFS